MPSFYVHAYAGALSRAAWGWLTRDPDPSGAKVALWYGVEPVPGRYPGAWVEWDVVHGFNDDGGIWFRRAGYRIVGADRRPVAYDIPDEDTAREILAWLCPKE